MCVSVKMKIETIRFSVSAVEEVFGKGTIQCDNLENQARAAARRLFFFLIRVNWSDANKHLCGSNLHIN